MTIEFNKVTWYSKLAAIIVFLIIVPVLAFIIGAQYGSLKTEYISSAGSTSSAPTFGQAPPQDVKLSASDNAKMLTLDSMQNFEISLPGGGDSAYTFDNPEYDTSLLHLNSHVHTPPATGDAKDFGTDVWQFSALKSGVTDITIIGAQGGANKQVIFKSSFGIR